MPEVKTNAMSRLGAITVAGPGVARCDFLLGFHHWGIKGALVRAGVARPAWFPAGQRDRRGRKIRTVKAIHNGQPVRCVAERDGWYRVTTYYAGAGRKRTAGIERLSAHA